MKTQNFGQSVSLFDSCPLPHAYPHHSVLISSVFNLSQALKNHRENRENGTVQDNPKNPFPSAGFDTLAITRTDWKSSNDWPDKQGRYWWKLTLGDGDMIEDFYWTKDEVRGFPDKKGCYWFIVHHKNGIKIEGFSEEPDYEKGFPDKDKNYWRYIQYTECGLIKAWMEEKDRNYLARLEREKKAKQREGKQASIVPRVEASKALSTTSSSSSSSTLLKKEAPSLTPLIEVSKEKDPNYVTGVEREKKAKQPEEAQRQPALQRQVQPAKPQATPEGNAHRQVTDLHMKTQNFGTSPTFIISSFFQYPLFLAPSLGLSLKNYRENRENGTQQDNPKSPFPSAGFDTLDIKNNNWKSSNDWPDKKGRSWWSLRLNDGSKVEDFYWTEDKVRGFPDKNNDKRYWFIVHHKNGTKIEGFSEEPDYQKGFPDKDKKYWYTIRFTDTYCPAIRQWMIDKDKNYLARLEREKKAKQPDVAGYPQPLEKAPQRELAPPRQMQPPPLKPQATPEESTRRQISHLTLNSLGQSHVDVVLPYEDFRLGKLLGKGGFGAVYEGDWQGVPIAIKKLFEKQATAKQEAEFRHEAGMMVQLRHPHIVTLYGITLNPENCMVLELMVKGSLYSVLHSDEPMSWQLRYHIGLDAAKGLAYLHGKHILHRDLKSLNVLLDKDYRAKLGDFGLSKIKATSTQAQQAGLTGTLQWIAPELFLDTSAQYTPACDVYSFAMIIWELMSRVEPYRNISVPALIPIHVGQGKRETIPNQAPAVLQQTTQHCWAQVPEKRPNMREVVKAFTDNPVTDNAPMDSPHHASSSARNASSSFFQSADNRYSSWEKKSDSPSSSYAANTASGESQPAKSNAKTDSGYLMYSQLPERNKNKQEASFSQQPLPALPELENDIVLEARATHSYRAKEANQLSFSKGATLQVIEQDRSGWWLCELADKQGLAPSNYLRLLDMAHEPSSSSLAYGVN